MKAVEPFLRQEGEAIVNVNAWAGRGELVSVNTHMMLSKACKNYPAGGNFFTVIGSQEKDSKWSRGMRKLDKASIKKTSCASGRVSFTKKSSRAAGRLSANETIFGSFKHT